MGRKIFGLILAAVLLIGMVSAGTWAYWSDTETSSANAITAGTLDLVPTTAGTYSGNAAYYHVTSGGNEVNGKVVFDRVTPGQSGTIKWLLSNSGNLAGTLTAPSTGTFAENGANAPESFVSGNNNGDNGDLDENLLVTLQKGVGTDQTSAEAALSYVNGSTPWAISGLEAVLDAQSQAMAASGGNDTVVYILSWSIASGTGNIIQSDTAALDITFTLNQQ